MYDAPPPDDALRFHAQWRQERPTAAVGAAAERAAARRRRTSTAPRTTSRSRPPAPARWSGCVLQIDNVAGGWYGEGDDMVFIDGETWPPSIHGTGTEEIFGGGACPAREYAGPYHGFHLIESPDYAGLVGAYRWFVHDPIRFTRSLRWTVEHGHANNFANEYASVAYWYQTEPHAPFPALADARRHARRRCRRSTTRRAQRSSTPSGRRCRSCPAPSCCASPHIGEPFYAGRFEETLTLLRDPRLGARSGSPPSAVRNARIFRTTYRLNQSQPIKQEVERLETHSLPQFRVSTGNRKPAVDRGP